MHRALSARWLNRALRINDPLPGSGLPLYLCPIISLSQRSHTPRGSCIRTTPGQQRSSHVETLPRQKLSEEGNGRDSTRELPLMCTGCGSFAQDSEPNEFGYFNTNSKRVRSWTHPKKTERKSSEDAEDSVVKQALAALDSQKLKELGLETEVMVSGDASEVDRSPLASLSKPPLCERCHDLLHHNLSTSTAKITMHHPTVESLRETIEESPHKYNHIYHIIDAADFPMSLIPRLNVLLGDIPLRSRNRRSRAGKYQADGKTEMSFIITRSDLLAPKKEMVDALLPYLREVLRDALGRIGGRVRLGNVSCVSAKRGWWTKSLKEEVWKRGGAGWMVGKVNVGKSQLFEAVYPKGRMNESKKTDFHEIAAYRREEISAESIVNTAAKERLQEVGNQETLEFGDLLPPAQPAANFPEMPIVSSLPGTTASPIRIPFGDGKGELIDLPGLARSDLELFVKEEHRQSLVMKKRIVPEQISVRPGKSLVLGGGLIRITPRSDNLIFLMYNFTPLEEHLTSTEKAASFQDQSRESAALENVTLPELGDKMKLAGTFKLSHDVTKKRAGPLTRKSAVGLDVDRLPFRVLSVDILIEGVGYVEVVAQVRARYLERLPALQFDPPGSEFGAINDAAKDPFADLMANRKGSEDEAVGKTHTQIQHPPEPEWPAVDVYTPEGRFVGSRRPINGWLNNKPLVLPEHKKSRPRRSMKGEKKKEKVRRRLS